MFSNVSPTRCVAHLISYAFMLLSTAASAQTNAYGKTVAIAKTVPDSVKTTKAPNIDPSHYRTLKNTQFSYRCHVPYVLKTGQAAIEVCEINPVKLQIINWPETEVIHLVSGRVTITHSDGSIHQYAAGDIFVLPEGFRGTWDQPEVLSKVVVRHPLYWKE